MLATHSPFVLRVGALLLVAVATLGVATPRARVTARERVGRAMAIRLGSPRVNDRLGWVAPDRSRATVAVGADPAPVVAVFGPGTTAQATLAAWPLPSVAAGASSPAADGCPDDPRPAAAVHRFRIFGRPPPRV